ncbi:MAG: SBBP repeat-containing protein [Ignavibacteria bacterium]|nr:SBBP repeat-containing protein [Ignavibacteria bacterium]
MATSLAVDGSGNVYVTGRSRSSGTWSDYATIKYNPSGVQQWVARYNGPGDADDYANSLAVDGSGNVYVTGSGSNGTSSEYATVKYNTSGVQQWVASYNGPSNSNSAKSLAVDGSGNVYVTGRSRGISGFSTSEDYATIKYSQTQAITQPSISISPIQINPGGSVGITGQNFRANSQIKVNVISANSEVVIDQTISTNSNGGFNTNYSSNVNSSPGIYTVSAYDIATSQNAPSKIFQVTQPVENFNLSIISPSAEYSPHPELDSIDKTVDIEWIDKMITGSSYTIVGSKRKYKYGLIYSTDYGLNWSDTIISEGFKDVNSISIFKNQLNLESLLNFRSGLNVMFRVIDIIKPNRFSTTAPKPVRLSRLTKANLNLIWDYSYINERNGSPIGACADGVGRFYIKISKDTGTYNITGVSLYLSDDKSSTTKNILGKLTYARDTDHYSIEANGASSVSLNDNESKDNYWYWYVSPDDFWRDAEDDTLMERIVKLNVTVYYSNGLPESETKSLKIIRTPLMLVHGFASNHTIWDNFVSKKNINSIYKFYWTPDLDKKALFDDNAQILLNYHQSGTINKHSFKYLILEARHAGYATNQVSYVAHSMGGCVVRAAAQSSRFYNITNYDKGYVNRIITVDTPHKGSYLADFVVKLKTLLKVGYIKKKIRDNLKEDFIASSFILNGNDIEISGAVKNLQVKGTGKYYFQETNIPSFLIAGDFIPGQSDDLSNIIWGLSYGKDFNDILGVLDEHLPKTRSTVI